MHVTRAVLALPLATPFFLTNTVDPVVGAQYVAVVSFSAPVNDLAQLFYDDGTAVLSVTFLPRDFRVTINDQPGRYFRVNHAFNGVVIPAAGTWRIGFEYRPAGWATAWTGAALGLAAVVAMALAAGRPLRRPGV